MFEAPPAPYIARLTRRAENPPLPMTETPPIEKRPDRKTVALWREHWQDESDAAFLYRRLAASSTDEEKRDLYHKLAAVEEKHTAVWEKIFVDHGIEVPPRRPSPRARLMAWIAGWFGPDTLHHLLLREEGLEVRGYISLYRESGPGSTGDAAMLLARESADHAETLSKLASSDGEPWHYTRSGGFLRNVVYGFNDGLTANFGLVAGVVGAQVEAAFIMLTGVAGMIADALSMGASGYLAAKERARGLRPRDPGGAGRAALHAGDRGGGARPPVSDQGGAGGERPRDRPGDHEVPGAGARRDGAGGARHRRAARHPVPRGLDHRHSPPRSAPPSRWPRSWF